MSRKIIVIALGCAVWLSGSVDPAFADDPVRIGSWNIQHLDSESRQEPSALADYIELANVDLLALQEIHDTDDQSDAITNSKLDEAFEIINSRTGQEWQYVLHPERDGVTRDQHVGIAWNAKRVTKDGEPHFVEVEYDNEETWKRTPYAVKFRAADGKTDFVVISLHMKSNVRVDDLPDPDEIRGLEAAALAAQLGNVSEHFEDADIVLIGDTNCLRANEPALATYAQHGLRDLNSKDGSTHRSVFQNVEKFGPFDRILVKTDQPEFSSSFQYILTPTDRKAHFDRLSDHWLIKAPIQVGDDDD